MQESVEKDCKHEDCKYRGTFDKKPCCCYMMVTGKPRGGIKDCDKYETGKMKWRSTLDGFRYES